MLPYQSSDLPQGQHRRQNSTPTVFPSPKVALLPATQHKHEHHRRGISMDQFRQKLEQQFPQNNRALSIEQGQRHQQQQHNLQEAQQQHPMARPGPVKFYSTHELAQHIGLPSYNQTTPDPEFGSGNLVTNISDTDFLEFLHKLKTDPLSTDSVTPAGYLEGFGNDLSRDNENSIPTWETGMNEMPESLSTSPRGSLQPRSELQRPCTPLNQTSTGYFPLTPATTPFGKSAKLQGRRTAGSSPTRRDNNMTIKASQAMQRGSSYEETFPDCNGYGISTNLKSPPNTVPHKRLSSFDVAPIPPPNFMNLSNLKMDFCSADNRCDSSHCSPMSTALSPTMSSFQSSPELAHMSLFANVGNSIQDFSVPSQGAGLPVSHSAADLGVCTSPIRDDSQPRSQSISELDIDASIEETGVTCDEIAAFICGPHPADGKWMCLYPDCEKKFGRKENIKSHVQTHLGDRQFRCQHCHKCFVRQHDLKRHAKIHSGAKPYLCPCGHGFARHDALTRHRQRGMCVGAFEGTPKKPSKRGRPKKTRPETEERLDKAARTRQKVLEKAYPSSMSGSSESSYPSPPEIFDDMDMGINPGNTFATLHTVPDMLPPDFFSYTPPASPGYSTGNCYSAQRSQHSYTPKAVTRSPSPRISSTAEEHTTLPSSHTSSRKSSSSYYSTLPELDISSSSPAASKYLDFDNGSDVFVNESEAASPSQSQSMRPLSTPDLKKVLADYLGHDSTPDAEVDLPSKVMRNDSPWSEVDVDNRYQSDQFFNDDFLI